MGARVFLGLGTNLGDRLANLQRAVDLLATTAGISVVRSSRIYETAPVGPPQPEYLNAVVEIDTDLDPHGVLAAAAAVENELHRVRGERWGPRTIDVDVLTFDRRTLDAPELTVPHPRMHERAFVLVPLLELEPDPPLPGGRRVSELSVVAGSDDVRLFAPPLRVA